MATARSSHHVGWWAAAAALAGFIVALAVALLSTHGSDAAPRAERGASGTVASGRAAFSWLVPHPAPSGWPGVTLSSGGATLFHPPGWKPIPGDNGTVSVALRSAGGLYLGYLNVTPKEGEERIAGWPAFRVARNRDEGDTDVREIAATEGLHFGDSRVSCVIDDYRSRVGSHDYRELACILEGPQAANVFVGASMRSDWRTLGPVLDRAASSLIER
jgi:hypothetical protein